MSLDDRTLLRLHVEAVWGIQLPHVLEPDSLLLPTSARPEWSLYVADLLDGTRFHLWRPDVVVSARAALRRRAADTMLLSQDVEDEPGSRREIALQQIATPSIELTTAYRIARQLTPTDQTLINEFDPQTAADCLLGALRPVIGVIQAGRLVSLAHSSRRTTQACELGIDTLPDARRQGYALAATLVWADLVSQEGLIPIYSAFATNRASLRLAASAGYRTFARGVTINSSAC